MHPTLLVALLLAPLAHAQQVADTEFAPRIERPEYDNGQVLWFSCTRF